MSANVVERVVVFAPTFPPAFKGGGPSRSLDALIKNMPEEFESFVITTDRDHGDGRLLEVPSNEWVPRGRSLVRYLSLDRLMGLAGGLIAARRQRPTILYMNSFFNAKLTILPLFLWRVGFWRSAVCVLAPRGEFGGGALERRSGRKRAYVRVFRFLRLDRRIVWHATAPHEVDDIRGLWGPNSRIILRVNDTLLPNGARTSVVPHGSILRAAFLGRLVSHKGLDIVLEALHRTTPPFTLDVFGSEEDIEYVAACRQLASSLPAGIEVNFRGAVAPENVRNVLSDHDVLLMPTAGENFGHVIAEALSVSCLVATTPTTPWTNVIDDGGGFIVADRSVDAWSRVIRQLQGFDTEEIRQLRRDAGLSYDKWAALPTDPHLFRLVVNHGKSQGADVA